MHQVHNHFGVGFGAEAVTAFDQQFAQRFVVFDDAVMHHGNVVGNMRVRVRLGRFTVRCPTGVSDAGTAVQLGLLRRFGQFLHLAYAAQAADVALRVDHRQTGGVITAVFQTT